MDFIHVIGTFFDNSMQHIIALASLIKDLRLGKNLLEINELVENNIKDINEELDSVLELVSNIFIDNNSKELIESLNHDIDLLNNNIDLLGNNLDLLSNNLELEKTRTLELENILSLRIVELEKNPIVPKHVFITLKQYDILESYERDTLYFIIEKSFEETSYFGDTFPFILGGSSPTKFGDSFPLIFN